jgi:hypothetical protein
MVLLSAITIVGMSAYYSIFGISSLFAGKKLFAGIMAGSLEFGKVITTTHLTRNWKKIGKIYKFYFILATIILITISSAGIYSYLTDAYQLTTQNMKVVNTQLGSLNSEERSLVGEKNLLIEDRNSIQNEIKSLRDLIEDNENRKSKLYESMNSDTTGTVNWNASIWRFNKDNEDYRNTIENLRQSKDKSTNRIREIDIRLKEIWTESGKVESSDEASNIGPLKKISELLNTSMDTVVKFFIFIIILVFDPLGILLIVQFNKMSIITSNGVLKKKSEKKEKIIYRGVDIESDIKKRKKNNPMFSSKKVIDKKEDDKVMINSKIFGIENNLTDDLHDEGEKNNVDKNNTIVNVNKSDVNRSSFSKDIRNKGKGIRVK